jgi:hypothetical protein
MRLASNVEIIFARDRWIVTNPRRRVAMSVTGDIAGFMRLLRKATALETSDPDESPAADLEASITELVKAGLIDESEADAPPHSLSGCEGSQWEAYFAGRRHAVHANYSNPEVLDMDRELMTRYAEQSPFPAVNATMDTTESLNLAHPAYGPPRGPAQKLGHLLFWTLGIIHEAYLEGAGEVSLRPIPSKGALHPIHALVSLPSGLPLVSRAAPGLWIYDPIGHALRLTTKISSDAAGMEPAICLGIDFERPLWRYRHDWAYKDVYFDLGHAVAGLHYVATALGIELKPTGVDEFSKLIDRPLHREAMCAYSFTTEPDYES